MNVQLLDTTLREGEQSSGVSFSLPQKLEIINALDNFGVEFIEVGHPAVSPDIKNAIVELINHETKAQQMVHCRANRLDINEAASIGATWIGIFFGTSELSLKHKFDIDRSSALLQIADSINFAKSLDLNVRFTAEDASRTEIPFLIEVAGLVEESGADRLSIADTVGILTPDKTSSLIEKVKNEIEIPLHFHGHNDFGMATANAISAASAGAAVVDVSVNGLGERCGIASLAEVAVVLKTQFGVNNDWDLSSLLSISRKVEELSGIYNRSNQPIVGVNAFTHKSGLHTRAVLKNPQSYEVIDPVIINQERKIIIDKFTGKDAVANRLNQLNIVYTDSMLNLITERIKSKAHSDPLTDQDLINFFR